VATPHRVDPITVSVVQHRLEAIVEEMGDVMVRTSYSQILNASRDFSVAILAADGRIVAQTAPIPMHVWALPWAAQSVLKVFKGRILPGDVFLLNDPYHGNSHLPDLTAFVPVFCEERLAFWCVNRAHQSDIGGGAHGGYNSNATEIWQEGLRIPPLQLSEGGKLRDDVLYLLQMNVRHPNDFRGDVLAMLGSAKTGEQRVQQLLEDYGRNRVSSAIEESLDGSERHARSCVASWKDGIYRGEAVLDDDGHNARDIHVRAKVVKRQSSVLVDLTASDPQVEGFVNSTYPTTYSAVALAFAFLLDSDIPKNAGTFRPLIVKARRGTVVWANPPAATTLNTASCGVEIVAAVLQALAPACPGRSIAGWSKRFRIALRGVDPRSRRPFIWHLFHAKGGGGASASGDGWSTTGEFVTVGANKFGSVELTEARFPLFFVRHEYRPNSGGDGMYRGGLGAILDLRMEADALGNTAGDGIRHAAYGLFGGETGRPHRYILRRANGANRPLRTKESGIRIDRGDILHIESAGGGGWGDPALRDSGARATDLRDGFVTRARRRKRETSSSSSG
jgi:N-methylhydantoinase B